MARRRTTPELVSKELSPKEIREAIPKLKRRIQELKDFQVEALTDRFDPKIGALEQKIDDTLVSIFGHNTVEYRRYSISSLDHAPLVMGGIPLHEAKLGIQEGFDSAVTKLASLVETLSEKLEDLGESPIGKARRVLQEVDIHPELQRAVGQLFADGHFANAVEDACKVLESYVKIRSGKHDLSGTDLMMKVFSPNNPILQFNELKTDTDRSEQQGMMFLYAGTMLAVRNPTAHGIIQDDVQNALEKLVFISFLMKSLDRAKKH